MSEDQVNIIDEDGEAQDEMIVLKERAAQLGLRISPKIGLEKLRAKVNAAMTGEGEPEEEEENQEEDKAPAQVEKDLDDWTVEELKAMPKIKREHIIRQRQYRDEMKLVRCQIYNLDPSKNDLNGEILTFRNKYLGIVKKMIPYGEATEGGYHIPHVLYKQLKGRKFLQKKSVRDPKTGQVSLKTQYVPEFNIVVLPPLTEEELKELALNQAAAERVGIN